MWNNGAPTIGTPRPAAPPTGGFWNNAAPQINVQRVAPQPYRPQPAMDRYALGASLGLTYTQAPQYQQSPRTYAQQPGVPSQRQNAFTFGQGGVSGNGQISFQDHARVEAALAKQLYEAAYASAQRGEFPMGWQLENMRYAASNAANQAATGRSTSWFTRPQFDPQWEQYNESVNSLRAMGRDFDLEAALPESLRGQNTGERWRGFQATPIGTAFGGGDGGGDAWGTAAPSVGPATSNFQRGSSFAGGGYNPVLQQHTPGATAFSAPWNAGGGSVVQGPGMAGMGARASTGGGYQRYDSTTGLGGLGTNYSQGQRSYGNSGGQIMRQREPGLYSPYPQNTPDRMLDMYQYGSSRFGATNTPFQTKPTTLNYGSSAEAAMADAIASKPWVSATHGGYDYSSPEWADLGAREYSSPGAYEHYLRQRNTYGPVNNPYMYNGNHDLGFSPDASVFDNEVVARAPRSRVPLWQSRYGAR